VQLVLGKAGRPSAAHRRESGRTLEPVPEEVRQQVGQAGAGILSDFAEAMAAYTATFSHEDVDCGTWLERLSARWRVAMEKFQGEQPGVGFLSDEAEQLYSALEDSFALSRSADEQRLGLRLGGEELLARLMGAGEGIWHEDWDGIREDILTELDRKLARPTELPRSTLSRPAHVFARLQRGRRERVRSLIDLVGSTYTATAVFYKALAPDGRRLDEPERAEALEHVEEVAACDRVVDLEREAFSQKDWEATHLMLAEMRSLRRSLILALSEDPDRRALAVTLPEARVRTFVMNERARGASWEAAVAKLKELGEER
jgi:hypothetical protein